MTRAPAVACALAAGLAPVIVAEPPLPGALTAPSPLHAAALDETRHAAGLLSRPDAPREVVARAVASLEAAVSSDPRLAAAWINLAAARIRLCEREAAMFAALVAATIEPSSRTAATNLKLARRLDCEEAGEPSPSLGAVLEAPGRPGPWIEVAGEARGSGRFLLAAFFETLALERGAERDPSLGRIAADFERAGAWQAALDVLDALPARATPVGRESLDRRLADVREAAEPVVLAVAREAGLDSAEEREVVRGLAEVLLARGLDVSRAESTLLHWLGVRGERRFSGGFGTFVASRAWVPVEPPEDADPGAWPTLVLRRFPGDTQVAAFELPGDGRDAGALAARIRGLLAGQGVSGGESWTACRSGDGRWCRRALFGLDLGPEGRGEVSVHVLGVDGAGPTSAVVGLAGDAGCGPPCAEDAREEIEALVGSWSADESAPRAASAWHVPVPRAWQSSVVHDESEHPWRTFPVEAGLRIDLPPGLVVGLVRGTFRPPDATQDARLWLRGRYVDREGIAVRIGDARHAGVVRVARSAAPSEVGPPAGDPGARHVATADISSALERAGVAGSGRVARFEGDAFAGTWLVTETRPAAGSGGEVVRVELPVADGAASLSLLWIALTIRAAGVAGPPPPVDTSERFEVRLVPLPPDRGRVDPRGGTLIAEQLRVSVPREFRVSLNSASRDGFPVTLRGPTGTRIVAHRWPAAAAADDERLVQASAYEGGAPVGGWSDPSRTRGGRSYAAAWPATENGEAERCVTVVLPEDPAARPAYRLRLVRGKATTNDDWRLFCGLVADSASYSSRKPP